MEESRKKPYRDIETVKDWIFYQYAKIIARAALESKGKKINKEKELYSHYGLIVVFYKDLKSGKKNMSDYLRDEKKEKRLKPECAYCGDKKSSLADEHIIPKNVIGEVMADHNHNLVLSCKSCNSSKGTKEFLSWWDIKFGENILPPKHVLSKYLKFLYRLHEANGTLNHPWNEWDNIFKK